MKSGTPNRRRVAGRLAILVLAAATGFVPSAAHARASDATHWLTPSQHSVDHATLYSSGIPSHDERPFSRGSHHLYDTGRVLYDTHCASCHGSDLRGLRGAPSLEQSGGAAVDFYMTTGRMPLAVRAAETGPQRSPYGVTSATGTQADHTRPQFDDAQIAALDAYVDARATSRIPIPSVHLAPATIERGRTLFEDNCEACHGAAAEGATVGYQWTALPLNRATATQIGEAIRIGPGVMPRFTAAELSDSDIGALASYVRYLTAEPQTYGGAVMDYLGPVAEGAVGAFGGVGLLFWVIYFTGTKADGRRVHELD